MKGRAGDAMPRVRLTLEGMQHQIVQLLSGHEAEIREASVEAVARAVAELDFDREIRQLVRAEISRALQTEIELCFRYGDGRDMVAKVVADTLAKSDAV